MITVLQRRAIHHLFAAFAFLPMLAVSGQAVTPSEMLEDPKLESRARAISQQLRCVVCQNQSIDDSNAPLAQDLRMLVRERLMARDTDEQVISFVVARYGNFVLLKPPMQVNTLLLWFSPVFLLGIAAIGFGRYLNGRGEPRRAQTAASFTHLEQERLDDILGKGSSQ